MYIHCKGTLNVIFRSSPNVTGGGFRAIVNCFEDEDGKIYIIHCFC